jgi:hypothetical protein
MRPSIRAGRANYWPDAGFIEPPSYRPVAFALRKSIKAVLTSLERFCWIQWQAPSMISLSEGIAFPPCFGDLSEGSAMRHDRIV